MLVNSRSHKNLSSNVNKILLQQKVFCIALLSIACISCTHARAYQDRNINPINWANYIAPSPLDMSGDAYQQHDGANADVEHTDGEVEDTPMKGNKPDVSTLVRYNMYPTVILITAL